MLAPDEYREKLENGLSEGEISKIRQEIINESQYVLTYCRIDPDDLDIYELLEKADDVETAEYFIDSTVGDGYKKDQQALKVAKTLIKRLVNSMHVNRSFEISSSAKTDLITKNLLAKLASLEVLNDT